MLWLLQLDEDLIRFLVIAPNLGAAGTATVLISVNDGAVPTSEPILYVYRAEYIQSIVPANGLVTGGQQVRDQQVFLAL